MTKTIPPLRDQVWSTIRDLAIDSDGLAYAVVNDLDPSRFHVALSFPAASTLVLVAVPDTAVIELLANGVELPAHRRITRPDGRSVALYAVSGSPQDRSSVLVVPGR